jgi:hypothetical protein
MCQELKSLEKTITNQNTIHEETKSRFNSGNKFRHSDQNLLSPTVFSFPSSFWQILVQYSERKSHECFLPLSFQLIIHNHPIIRHSMTNRVYRAPLNNAADNE